MSEFNLGRKRFATILLVSVILSLSLASPAGAQPYIGEIRMFAGNFAPAGWAFCDGHLLPITEYDTLFTLIGTTYGGDGVNTFAVPDLSGRAPIHMGTGPSGSTYMLGQQGGNEQVTLTTQQIPLHTQPIAVNSNPGNTNVPRGSYYAKALLNNQEVMVYGASEDPVRKNLPSLGGSVPHDNMQPYLTINFIISLYGIFPSQS